MNEINDNMLNELTKYLSEERMIQISEEIYRKKFEEFIDNAISNRTLGFDSKTIDMLFDKALQKSIFLLVDRYDDQLYDMINETLSSDLPGGKPDIIEGISNVLIDESKIVINKNRDEIHKKLEGKIDLSLNVLLSNKFYNMISYNLKTAIDDIIKEQIKKIADSN